MWPGVLNPCDSDWGALLFVATFAASDEHQAQRHQYITHTHLLWKLAYKFSDCYHQPQETYMLRAEYYEVDLKEYTRPDGSKGTQQSTKSYLRWNVEKYTNLDDAMRQAKQRAAADGRVVVSSNFKVAPDGGVGGVAVYVRPRAGG